MAKYNPPALHELLEDVCASQEMAVDVVAGKSREQEISAVRQVFCLVACLYTKYSCNLIGALLGNRDHSTVITARNAAQDLLETGDTIFLEKWEKFKANSKYFHTLSIVRKKRPYLKNL